MSDPSDDLHNDPLLAAVTRELQTGPGPALRSIERALGALSREQRRRRWLAASSAAAAVLLGITLDLRIRARATLPVEFSVQAPASQAVTVVGDFNDWNRVAAPLTRHDGEWTVTLKLRPGRYRYAFLLDGSHWTADHRSPSADNDFDIPTSVITVAN